ncbi:MAG: DUF1232 domain-containing protein [Bacteroidales bacterium]|jgi:uncharacterized membrane protein YkvA (DUF1232 family)|nr:DUF1232 domain-containing protein [Bacteroidales bacterium]
MKAPKDLERYTVYYNAEKLWKKIKRHAKKIGAKAVYYALVLYYALQSPKISKKDKMIIYGALGYLILPIDLLPDFLPGGYTDDVAGLAIAIFKIARNITPEVRAKAQDKVNEWFGEVDPKTFDITDYQNKS